MKHMRKLVVQAGICALAALGFSAQAAVVSSLPGGTALVIPSTNQLNFSGPATLAPGVTYQSTEGSAYGWTGGYGFASNGSWSGTPMIGLDRPSGSFTLSFASGISGFLGNLNWTTFSSGDAKIEALDASGGVLESLLLEQGGANLVTSDADWGFSRSASDIFAVRFSEEYIGVRNIFIASGGQSVPEPATLALLGLGLCALSIGRKRRDRNPS